MERLGKVRRMQVRDKLSERAIAKRTGLSRNTVHKWLETPEEVQAPKYVRTKGFNKLGDFTDELEQSLKADALRPKRQTYSTRTVCAYQGQWLRRRLVDRRDAELERLQALNESSQEMRGEWARIELAVALSVLESL